MPRNTFRILCAFLVAAPLGCGARTTLFDEPVGGEAGTSSGGSPTGSGATAGAGGVDGGSGGIGASGGSGASGGVAGTGMGGVGGSVIGGSGPGGTAGAGGGPSPGRLRQACRDLCKPYAVACPTEFGSVEECTRDCVDSLSDTPAACRELTAEALDCLGAYLTTDATCEEALTKATFYCQDELLAIDGCNDVPRPDPPLDCTGTATNSPESCTVNLTCDNGNYFVGCKQVDPQQSLCSCSNDSSSTTLTVYGPAGDACGEALTRCGYAF